MPKPGATGLTRIINASRYSWQGLRATFRNEAAFRQELACAALLVPLGFWLGDTGVEKALLIGCVVLVLVVELLNTAIEYVVDRFGEEMHAFSGLAKDAGSAAVFLSLVHAVIVWLLVLLN